MSTTADDRKAGESPRRRPRLLLLLPLFVFVVLAGIFLMRLTGGGDLESIPSALIGKPAPDFALEPLEGSGKPGLARTDLEGAVTVVNVFASWCGPCRLEHPQLMELAEDDRFRLVGINYKDNQANAVSFLEDLGDPYQAIGVDPRGRASIDWGVYGIPETFIVGRDGTILFKHIGPISAEGLETIFKPEIEKALAGSSAASQ